MARVAGRGAALQAVSGASVTIVAGGETAMKTTNPSGWFSASGLPAGNYAEATAVFSGNTMKAFYDIPAGGTASKNINSRSTAASMVYLQLKNQGKSTPSSISPIENLVLIEGVETEIETALQNSTYNYNTQYASASVQAVINRIDSGGSFSDTTAPSLSAQTPESGALVSDVDFRSENFSVVFIYFDSYPMYFSSLIATLKMDDGNPQDISSYLNLDSTTISSDDIYEFNRTLFDLPSNDVSRTMTITISVEDMSGNTGAGSVQFTVYPVSPPS